MKKYDVVARVGSYTDPQTNQEKGKFKNVGAVIQNKNGGFNLLLDKTFNPAGLATPENESVILSLYEPDQQGQQAPMQQQPQQGYQQQPQNGYQQQTQEADIPF